MKKILCVLGLFGLLFNSVPANAVTIVEKPMGYISVNSSATGCVTPNVASITFAVETKETDSKAAVDKNSQITSEVLNELKSILKSDLKSQIKTKNYSMNPYYEKTEKGEGHDIKGYVVTNMIEVKTSNVEKVGELIQIGANKNVSQIGNVTFYTDDNNNGSEIAVNEAINNARKLAELAAKNMNQKIIGIKSLNINIYQQNNRGQMFSVSAEKSKNSVPIEKGNVQLNVNVSAEFYVK